MQASKRMLLLTVAVAALAASNARADSTTCSTISRVPVTINNPGTYCLDRSLADPTASPRSGTAPQNAITINSDFVVLDLNGFTLGSGAGGGATELVGIYAADRKSVTVKNGRVYGFLRGIYMTGPAGSNHLVEDVRAERNTLVGISVEGAGGVVRNNQVSSTSGTTTVANPDAVGIQVLGAGARVLNNDVIDSVAGGTGVAAGIRLTGASGAVVETNRVGNTTLIAGSVGIEADGGSDVLIVGNRVVGTDTGIAYTNGGDGKFRDNLTSGVNTAYVGGTDVGNNQ